MSEPLVQLLSPVENRLAKERSKSAGNCEELVVEGARHALVSAVVGMQAVGFRIVEICSMLIKQWI